MKDLSWPEFQFLARNVASELEARRAETWTVAAWHENHARPAATLDGPGSARLFIQYGAGGTDKITVTGLLPEGTNAGRRFTASVDPARGARAVAQAGDTRVLRAGYLDILPGKVAQKQANDAATAARDAAAARAAALFGVPAPDDGELSLSRFLPEHSKAEFRTHGGRVSLDLNGVPQETALRILAVLAADTQTACCYSFGPGHHPDLSTAGCLREDAERGHDASRQRATRLLAGHGIDAGQAGELLDAAYRGDTSGNYDEATGMRAGYDRAHGELTVNIPRQKPASSPPAPEQEPDSRGQAVTGAPLVTSEDTPDLEPAPQAAAPSAHGGTLGTAPWLDEILRTPADISPADAAKIQQAAEYGYHLPNRDDGEAWAQWAARHQAKIALAGLATESDPSVKETLLVYRETREHAESLSKAATGPDGKRKDILTPAGLAFYLADHAAGAAHEAFVEVYRTASQRYEARVSQAWRGPDIGFLASHRRELEAADPESFKNILATLREDAGAASASGQPSSAGQWQHLLHGHGADPAAEVRAAVAGFPHPLVPAAPEGGAATRILARRGPGQQGAPRTPGRGQ